MALISRVVASSKAINIVTDQTANHRVSSHEDGTGSLALMIAKENDIVLDLVDAIAEFFGGAFNVSFEVQQISKKLLLKGQLRPRIAPLKLFDAPLRLGHLTLDGKELLNQIWEGALKLGHG